MLINGDGCIYTTSHFGGKAFYFSGMNQREFLKVHRLPSAERTGEDRRYFAQPAYRCRDDFEGEVDVFRGGVFGEAEAEAGSSAGWGEAHGGEDVGRFGGA